MRAIRKLALFSCIAVCAPGCAHLPSSADQSRRLSSTSDIQAPLPAGADEGIITLIGTNDVHGRFLTESAAAGDVDSEGAPLSGAPAELLGGSQWFAGYVAAIRAATLKRYGDRGIALLLDAGDAAQGTLISNTSEGLLATDLMNHLKYAAAIPGNHAFDFGPIDPNIDQCPIGSTDCDPLGALKRFGQTLNCPLLGANVKLATDPAKTAAFLKDYALLPFMGRHIAVIGLENPSTPSTTYRTNVQSLKFTSGIEETRQLVATLKSSGSADVFVVVTHDGDQPKESSLLDFIKALSGPDGTPLVDAVIAGHTHRTEEGEQGGIPYVQSNWGGKYFGLIELTVRKDPTTGLLAVERPRTRKKAAIPIVPQTGAFMGESVQADEVIAGILDAAVQKVKPLADRRVGTLTTALSDDGKRDNDSEVGNFVADMMKRASGAEVSVIGSGDIRIGIPHPEGDSLTYNALFEVLPKSLQLVTVAQMPVSMLLANLKLSIQSCGHRGALQQSGLQVFFERDCSRAVNGIDPKAKLVQVIGAQSGILFPGPGPTTVAVTTSDFILTGGAGYTAFSKLAVSPEGRAMIRTNGPLRDLIAAQTSKLGPMKASDFAPGRYINCLTSSGPTLPNCH